jgi:hypothetical protein
LKVKDFYFIINLTFFSSRFQGSDESPISYDADSDDEDDDIDEVL